jgi:hypothetical protein
VPGFGRRRSSKADVANSSLVADRRRSRGFELLLVHYVEQGREASPFEIPAVIVESAISFEDPEDPVLVLFGEGTDRDLAVRSKPNRRRRVWRTGSRSRSRPIPAVS